MMANQAQKIVPRLEGKVAVVTAATLGIGYATAERLAQEGAKVMISSRKQENVDKAVNELRSRGHDVRGVVCHVGKEDHRKRMLEETVRHFGGIDILVSNAGVNPATQPVLETPESIWDKIVDINLKASFLLVKETVPFIVKRGGGSIVVVSSIAGFGGPPTMEVYGVTKTALFGLVKSLSRDLAQENIRINALAPGFVKTKLSQLVWTNESLAESTKSSIMMKRFGMPEEMASAVAFLVSEDASYVTAEVLAVGGGFQTRL